MSASVIRSAARALNPDKPIRTLASLVHCPRPTAKAWANGHRRPPVVVLKILRDLLKNRQAALLQLIDALEYVIMQREREPKHRTGFNLIDPLTGMDRRNRLGRPRRVR